MLHNGQQKSRHSGLDIGPRRILKKMVGKGQIYFIFPTIGTCYPRTPQIGCDISDTEPLIEHTICFITSERLFLNARNRFSFTNLMVENTGKFYELRSLSFIESAYPRPIACDPNEGAGLQTTLEFRFRLQSRIAELVVDDRSGRQLDARHFPLFDPESTGLRALQITI